MFGTSGRTQPPKNLVEIRAGKMSLQGRMVKPDKRKGLLYVYQSEDTLNHFCWKDRTTNAVEEDLILFPEDLEYKRIASCTTGRVFLVNIKSANKKMFFWMQEPDADKDEKLWKKLSDTLNGIVPTTPSSGGTSSASASNLTNLVNALGSDLGGSDIQSLLGSMSEQQIQQLLGLSGFGGSQNSSRASSSRPSRVQSSRPATTTTTTTTPTTTTSQAQPMDTSAADSSKKQSTQLQFSDFQNFLQNIQGQNPQATSDRKLNLADVVTLDVMAPILAHKDIQERLLPHLPEGDVLPNNEAELRSTLSAPQFKRAMQSFSDALQSGQLGPLLAQFNLPKEVIDAANIGNLEEFAKAMQKHSSSKSTEDDQKMDH